MASPALNTMLARKHKIQKNLTCADYATMVEERLSCRQLITKLIKR